MTRSRQLKIKRRLRSVRKKLRKICIAWKNAENGYSR
jgi:hypothetical protein